jgi:hypothetical protein
MVDETWRDLSVSFLIRRVGECVFVVSTIGILLRTSVGSDDIRSEI